MKKFTTLLTLVCAFFAASATAQISQTVVYDFSHNNWKFPGLTFDEGGSANGCFETKDYTYKGNTVTVVPKAPKGQFYYDQNALRIQSIGTKIVLPAFDFAVEKIEFIGHKSGSQSADMNIYVGDTPVSTACKDGRETHTFEIAEEYRAAGNVYEFVMGESGGLYSSILYITAIKVYPIAGENELAVVPPTLDNSSGVYTGPVTVKVSSPTAEAEGVTDVCYIYTTNGLVPDPQNDNEIENGEITIDNSCTLKVILEFTYDDNTYYTDVTEAKYIISNEVTYAKSPIATAGKFFIVADGKLATACKDYVLTTKETVVTEEGITDAEYYSFTFIEHSYQRYQIMTPDGNYLHCGSSSTNSSEGRINAHASYASQDSGWEIIIEDGVAKIKRDGWVLVCQDNTIVAILEENVTDATVFPEIYTLPENFSAIEGVDAEAEDAVIYDLLGRRVEKITKAGIYIVNGKKVLVK